MNRRSFLKGLGAVLIGLQIPLAAARGRIPFADPRTWRERLPVPQTLEELGPAIERLFPGEVLESARAYEEFADVMKVDASNAVRNWPERDPAIQRCVHTVFALVYVVPHAGQEDIEDGRTTVAEKTARLERTLVRCHYQTMRMLAERPENEGATLIWRWRPEGLVHVPFSIHGDDFGPGPEKKRVVRMRFSLKQNGWRAKCMVEPNLGSSLIVKEGQSVGII